MTQTNTVEEIVSQPYKYGFITDIETEKIPKGLSKDVIRLISAKKNEPEFLLRFRLRAYEQWLKMKEPDWSGLTYSKVDYQDLVYYAAPKQDIKKKRNSELHSNGAKAARHINKGIGGTVRIASVNICNTLSIHPP